MRKSYPFIPGDKLKPWELAALQDLMRASEIPEGYMSAEDVNDLIERWCDPSHTD